MSETMIEIYGLFCPKTDRLRYIGKARNSKKRFQTHLKEGRRRYPVYEWIASLRAESLIPILRVLSRVPENDWQHEERRLIFEARLSGDKLLNIADGGDEPHCPAEVRSRNGAATAKKIHSDPKRRRVWEIKRAIGYALRKGWVSNSSRAKLRLAAQKAPHLFGIYAGLEDVPV